MARFVGLLSLLYLRPPLGGVDFVDTQVGYAVGSKRKAFYTTDGGATWTAGSTGTGAGVFRAVAAVSAQIAYLVGDGGLILKTTDGGANWSAQTSGTSNDLCGVAFPLDALHGYAVGATGTIVRTDDGGQSWVSESVNTSATLRAVAFPTYWTEGYAVGAGGAIIKRIAERDASLLFDTEVANMAPPTLVPSLDAGQRIVFSGNNDGYLFAVDAANRVLRDKPVAFGNAVQGRGPVGQLAGETTATIFVSTAGGLGYAIDASTGTVRWTTDGDADLADIQPLGTDLVAAPVVSPSRNLAFFATRNIGSAENRVFAFDAKDGTCRFVVNGDCNGATGSEGLGQISSAPLHNFATQRLYLTSTSLLGTGATVWAVDASDSGGAVIWSRDLGGSDVSPAFADTSRASLFVGNNDGELYRLQASDGESCWSSTGSGCGAFGGEQQAYCTATDALQTTACSGGSAVTSGFYVIWGGTQAGNVVFVTADGHVRMIDPNGALVWKTTSPIAGASFPLLQIQLGTLYVGAADGYLHELSLADGTETGTQQVGDDAAAVGSPTYDVFAEELYVGTASGKLYHFSLPF